jgi:F0F1-type ATP synthase epsilon subunit
MAEKFDLELVTPTERLVSDQVSEVVLPAYDGEDGILAKHEDFVGLLGTGALKLVRGGNDYWYLVSAGVYQISNGKLTICAELAEEAKNVNIETVRVRLAEIDKALLDNKLSDTERQALTDERVQQKARLDVHRRTTLVN